MSGLFGGILTSGVYDIIKNIAQSYFKSDELKSKLTTACDNAADSFYKKYGNEFGDKISCKLTLCTTINENSSII